MELTNRDFNILEFLYHQGVATPMQLTDLFFSSSSSARVRLHQLKKNGFIESRPLSELKKASLSAYSKENTASVFGIRNDLYKFKVYCLGNRMKKSYPKADLLTQPLMWKHQIQLNRIRTFFQSKFPQAVLISDPEIREFWKHFKQGSEEVIPDLVVQMGNLRIAVEVERNTKTSMTYYSRFLRYRDAQYTHVFYFCETEKVFSAVASQSSTFRKVGISLLLSPNRVFQEGLGYLSVEDFLNC